VECVDNGISEHLCVIAIGMLNGNKKVVEEFARYQEIHKHFVQKSSKKVHWGDEHTLRHQKQCEHNGTSKDLCTMAIKLLNGSEEANEVFLHYQLDGIVSNLQEKSSEFNPYNRQLNEASEVVDDGAQESIAEDVVGMSEDSETSDHTDSDETIETALII
jgi:hypothetical protein